MPELDDVFHAAVVLFFHVIPSRFGGWQHPDQLTPDGSPIVWTSDYELRKLTVSWSRAVGLTPPQDVAQCTHHFLNLTGGDPDSTWTDSDFTTVETAYNAFWAALLGQYHSSVSLTEYAWRKDGPLYRPHTPAPGGLLSPTVRTVPKSVPGTNASQQLPPQCAVTVTEVVPAHYTVTDVEGVGTQVRNRWGRFYLPAPATVGVGMSILSGEGRIASQFCQTIADAAQDMYDACNSADIVPVMYSPTTGNAWAIQSLHVDDLWDVIRSRRWTEPTSRHVVELTDPPPEI